MNMSPLTIKITLESNPLRSTMLVGGLGVIATSLGVPEAGAPDRDGNADKGCASATMNRASVWGFN